MKKEKKAKDEQIKLEKMSEVVREVERGGKIS